MSDIIKTRIHLQYAAERLLVAYWAENTNYHRNEARSDLRRALGGDDLEGIIVEAIDNVHDMDVTFEDYARSIVNALLDHAIPLTEE